jgi:hypothetical protein
MAKRLTLMRKTLKRQVYISCWHANDDESEAMWVLYCGQKDGIALQTSYQRLDSVLHSASVDRAKPAIRRHVKTGHFR